MKVILSTMEHVENIKITLLLPNPRDGLFRLRFNFSQDTIFLSQLCLVSESCGKQSPKARLNSGSWSKEKQRKPHIFAIIENGLSPPTPLLANTDQAPTRPHKEKKD